MATEHHTTQPGDVNSVWQDSFPPEVRKQQLEDDSLAWKNVTGVLLLVISIGLILALITNLLTR